jgi:transposase
MKAGAAPTWGTLPQINANAAGLDISATEIVACVPSERAEQPIQVFSTYTPDLRRLVAWLEGCGIQTVAMEATGVYWIPVYELLEERGVEVVLVNARHLKNVPGRKSDICDSQWIQTLHSYGLVRGSFVPEGTWRTLRAYWRQRQTLIEHRAPHLHHMQKALQQMNVHLSEVLSDIGGVTGMQIMRAIVAGERDPGRLARFRDKRCAHSVETIEQALSGTYREEHVFALKQALVLYDAYTVQIGECDAALERQYAQMTPPPDVDGGALPPVGPPAKRGSHCKNGPGCDVRGQVYRLTGVDLVAVTGLQENTVQTIIAEIGTDMSRWRSVKHFCSWLGLAPHNDISGGKVLRSATLKGRNRAGQALRLAAQSVTRSNSAFGAFYRRLAARLGVQQAIVATAHKIARTVYTLLKKRVPFQEVGAGEYERRHRERVIAGMRRRARSLGFTLVPEPTATAK